MKFRRLAICGLLPLFFLACSDGVGGGGPGTKGKDNSLTVSGTVIDGYVVGAKLFCLEVASSLDAIASSVASSKSNRWLADDVVEELSKASLLTVVSLTSEELTTVRLALTVLAAAAANQPVAVEWPGQSPQDPPNPLASALKLKGDAIKIFSKTAVNSISILDFEMGTTNPLNGLRGASFALEQATAQLPEVPSSIGLGFSIESTASDGFVAHAIIDKASLPWTNEGLALEEPNDSMLSEDLFREAISLSNSSGAIAKLISSTAGELKIDLVALAESKGQSAAVLDAVIGSGSFTVSATLSELKIVRLKAGQLERRPNLSVSAAGTTVTGATFRGTIKIQ